MQIFIACQLIVKSLECKVSDANFRFSLIFVQSRDTLYFTALVNPKDQWHQSAIKVEPLVEMVDLVTTEEVLIELLNFYSEFGSRMRFEVSMYVRQLLLNPKFEIIGRDEMSFLEALELYESRLDKGYSLTDCISMNVCRSLGITEILTHDRHFEQEGFTILL